MLVGYALTNLGFMGPNPVGTTSTDTAPLIVPAGYAFAIWGPIYLGLIAFPIYQLVTNRENHPNWTPLRGWYAANVVANGLWLIAASFDWQWVTVGIIVFMLISLFRINQLLHGIEADGAARNYWLERLVFSLYFAWITLATVLNVASALHFYDWNGFGISEVNWTVMMIFVAALIAGFTSWRFRDAPYAGVVVWAFVALTLKHWNGAEGPGTQGLAYLSLAVVVFFTGLFAWMAIAGRGTSPPAAAIE